MYCYSYLPWFQNGNYLKLYIVLKRSFYYVYACLKYDEIHFRFKFTYYWHCNVKVKSTQQIFMGLQKNPTLLFKRKESMRIHATFEILGWKCGSLSTSQQTLTLFSSSHFAFKSKNVCYVRSSFKKTLY